MEVLRKTKDGIISHAITIIAEEGIQNLSIRHIAQRVGIKESSIYSHFESKDEIIKNVLEVIRKDALNMWVDIYKETSDPLVELSLFFKKTCEGHIVSPNNSKVLWFSSHHFKGEHFEVVKEVFEIHRSNMYKSIENCRKAGVINSRFKNEYLSSLISGQAYIFLLRNLCTIDYEKHSIDELWDVIKSALTTLK